MNRFPIDEFTYEDAKRLKPEGPINLPSSTNSNRLISNDRRFEAWKEEMMKKYPEAIIQFSPEDFNPFKLISDEFLRGREALSRNIEKYGSLD